MPETGVSYNTAVHKHETATGEGHRVVDDWHEPYSNEPVTPPKAQPKALKRPATAYEAAMVIARWIDRRFPQVFWYCKRCVRWGPCAPEHHSRVSNFGICESCHNETRDEDLQIGCIDFRAGRFARSRFDPDYDGMDNLRWVGPRHTREHRRAWAVHDKRLEPFYWHKKQFVRYHEELMAAAWHPTRVAGWLEQGEDVLDMMMGVD
jgi:hypothetical protein